MDIFQETFRIGEFAKFARVTIKMLRNYDRLGLLKPVAVDPETQYRYYSADQLPRLNRIIALKDLGFSLEQIKQMLEAGLSQDELKGMLTLKRAEIQAQIEHEQDRLQRLDAHLEQLAQESDAQAYDVVIRPIEAQLVARIRDEISVHNNEIGDLFDELETYAAGHRARANFAPMTITHQRGPDEMDIEVIVPITRPIPTNNRVEVTDLTAVPQMACVIHTGPYSTLNGAYHVFYTWLAASEYQMAGLPRVVYLRFSASEEAYQLPPNYITQHNHRFVTELQFPIHKPDRTSGL